MAKEFLILEANDILAVRESNPPRKGQTTSGYGGRLPTRYEIQTKDKRWHRVRVVCYANAGTPYITVKGALVLCETAYNIFKARPV